MLSKGTLIIYEKKLATRSQRYCWKFVYANGKNGPRSEEGFDSAEYAESQALKFMGRGEGGPTCITLNNQVTGRREVLL